MLDVSRIGSNLGQRVTRRYSSLVAQVIHHFDIMTTINPLIPGFAPDASVTSIDDTFFWLTYDPNSGKTYIINTNVLHLQERWLLLSSHLRRRNLQGPRDYRRKIKEHLGSLRSK